MRREILEKALVQEEGEVLYAYQDHLGYWTIGVGHLIDKRRGGGISREISRRILAEDIDRTEGLLEAYPWYRELDSGRQTAVVAMSFQLGVTGVQKFRRMIAALEEDDYDAAARAVLASLWATQTPARAERVARALRSGLATDLLR